MKNKLVVEENIDKKEYKPIIKITMEDEEFIIYTKDEINKLGDVICYVSSYCYEDGKQVLKPIKDKRKLEILDNIFLQVQNLINKIWFRTDDLFTIEEAQKQLGKEEKIHTSRAISENAKETKFNYITNSLNSQNSSITESFNTYTQKDDRLAAPFETSERKKNCLLRVNHILTDVVYLVYPALLFYLMVFI